MRLGVDTVFGSDWHTNHKAPFIYEPRGFTSQEAHDEALIERMNKKVPEGAVLVNAGDFALKDPDGSVTESVLSRLHFKILYVNGNHPSGVKQLYKKALIAAGVPGGLEAYPVTWGNITFVGKMFECQIANQLIVVTHYPMLTWEGSGDGSWNLHGHEHNSLPDSLGAKRLDVGVDRFPNGISFSELQALMQTKSIFKVGHH